MGKAMTEISSREFHGRFIVRLPKSLHEALAVEAERENVSMNTLIIVKLCLSVKERLNGTHDN